MYKIETLIQIQKEQLHKYVFIYEVIDHVMSRCSRILLRLVNLKNNVENLSSSK